MTGRKLLVLVLVFLLLFSFPLFPFDYLYSAKIERVIDGDTIVVDLDLGLAVILNDSISGYTG